MITGVVQISTRREMTTRTVSLTLRGAFWCSAAEYPHVSSRARTPSNPKKELLPEVVQEGDNLCCTFLLEPLSLLEIFMTDEQHGYHCVYCLLGDHLAVIEQEGMQLLDHDSLSPLSKLVDLLTAL